MCSDFFPFDVVYFAAFSTYFGNLCTLLSSHRIRPTSATRKVQCFLIYIQLLQEARTLCIKLYAHLLFRDQDITHFSNFGTLLSQDLTYFSAFAFTLLFGSYQLMHCFHNLFYVRQCFRSISNVWVTYSVDITVCSPKKTSMH